MIRIISLFWVPYLPRMLQETISSNLPLIFINTLAVESGIFAQFFLFGEL
jgi:hypothetical protein